MKFTDKLLAHHTQPSLIYRARASLKLTKDTNLFWYYNKNEGINFGDWIGPYLFYKKTGELPFRYLPRGTSRATTLFTVGSILHRIRKPGSAIVWGTGAISETIRFPQPKKIRAVRGPLTRQVCLKQGYACPEIFGDPAILLPDFFEPPQTSSKSEIGIVPHYIDQQLCKKYYSQISELRVIDVNADVEDVVSQIASCDYILSSSLHGLIVAHSFDIPAAWVELTGKLRGGTFKFRDYFAAANAHETTATQLTGNESAAQLKEIVKKATQPRLDRLRAPLIRSCPF
ncbi:polysaccharide pyruvyl transferase family protein [Rhodosalinus sp. FB01]|uniref:polysaccharide pyruvyl transferase family protein n=1 Tax=Rhodosalinus sp. FB01 TaxID=3239194 RepID=UPI003523C59C